MTNITSRLYPDAHILNESAATFGLRMVQTQIKNQTWTDCTREELLEAAAALVMRLDYLWENGGKQAFDELVQREFGRTATK